VIKIDVDHLLAPNLTIASNLLITQLLPLFFNNNENLR
jgi:hypothetical protein